MLQRGHASSCLIGIYCITVNSLCVNYEKRSASLARDERIDIRLPSLDT